VHPDHPRDPAGVRAEAGEAATVAEICTADLEAGQSLYGVAKHLMALRVLPPGGHARWNQATIRGILSNPASTGQVYAGRLRSHPARQRRSALTPIGHQPGGRTKTPAAEWLLVAQGPPIVSQEQFALVQPKLAHNQQLAMRHHTAHAYLLRGLVSCGLCRTSCRARTASPVYGYDVCRGKMHPPQSCRDRQCPARFIPARRLDALVWHDLYEALTHPEARAQALQRAQGGHWLPQA
jgi:site-specific DNA recombinase